MSGKTEMNEFVRRIRSAGGEVTRRRRGHLVVTVQGRPGKVFLSCTPSDHRARANNIAMLRRVLGLEV